MVMTRGIDDSTPHGEQSRTRTAPAFIRAFEPFRREVALLLALLLVFLFFREQLIGWTTMWLTAALPVKVDYTIEFVKALAWPLVLVVALVLFRDAIVGLFAGIGQRVTKLSVFQVSLELARAPEATELSMQPVEDIRTVPAVPIADSGSVLRREIESGPPSDFAVIHVESGKEWITSRLFLAAALLPRTRQLKYFVFTYATNDVDDAFLGIASADHLRLVLAGRTPRFEEYLCEAYVEVTPHYPWNYVPIDSRGQFKEGFASALSAAFLMKVSRPSDPRNDMQRSPDERLPGVDLSEDPQAPRWEVAEWIDRAYVVRILGRNLDTDAWIDETPDQNPAERNLRILRRDGPMVAVLGTGRRFRTLVDRIALLEKIGRRASEHRAPLPKTLP
jgi:hypothetical protein